MTAITANVRSNPFSQIEADAKLQQEIAATETQSEPTRKRGLKIPDDVPNALDCMLRTTAMQIDAGNIPAEREEKARKDLGWAWANMNANQGDKRYQTLVDLALMFPKEDAVPPVMVHPSFRPETVSESALRLLRLVKQTLPGRFTYLLDNARRLRILDLEDLKRL